MTLDSAGPAPGIATADQKPLFWTFREQAVGRDPSSRLQATQGQVHG